MSHQPPAKCNCFLNVDFVSCNFVEFVYSNSLKKKPKTKVLLAAYQVWPGALLILAISFTRSQSSLSSNASSLIVLGEGCFTTMLSLAGLSGVISGLKGRLVFSGLVQWLVPKAETFSYTVTASVTPTHIKVSGYTHLVYISFLYNQKCIHLRQSLLS
jgi:hypothetical protein